MRFSFFSFDDYFLSCFFAQGRSAAQSKESRARHRAFVHRSLAVASFFSFDVGLLVWPRRTEIERQGSWRSGPPWRRRTANSLAHPQTHIFFLLFFYHLLKIVEKDKILRSAYAAEVNTTKARPLTKRVFFRKTKREKKNGCGSTQANPRVCRRKKRSAAKSRHRARRPMPIRERRIGPVGKGGWRDRGHDRPQKRH